MLSPNPTAAHLLAVCLSKTKGTHKDPVPQARILKGRGIQGDAHAGPWHRQVSLLADESVAAMRAKGIQARPGLFAENLLTRGINLVQLPIGTRLRIGGQVLLKVTQIGKTCHERCAIYYQAGDCVMPREGIFAEVLSGGCVKPGDPIVVLSNTT